jgi:putative peptidoglycan lipid II flippase
LYLFLLQGWQWTQMDDLYRVGCTLMVVVCGVLVYVLVAVAAGLRPSILKH